MPKRPDWLAEEAVVAKASPMPTDERFELDDCDDLQDRREPSIQLDEEPAVGVCELNAAVQLAPQHDQLMAERRVVGFKLALRLEWRGQDGQDETEQRDHRAL